MGDSSLHSDWPLPPWRVTLPYTYLKRYADQKASTASSCSRRDLEDGLPGTWSIIL